MPKIRHINTPRVDETKVSTAKATRGLEELEITTPDSIVPNGEMQEIMKDYFQGNFLSTKEGTFEIGASYMGGKPKITTITVKPIPAKLLACEFTGSSDFVYKNELAEVLLTFDKPISEGMSGPTFRTNTNLMVASSITYDEDMRSGTFKVMGVNPGDGMVTAGLGGVTLQATILVKDSPAVLTRLIATPERLIEGETFELRGVHDKKPDISLINVEADPTLELVGEIIIEGNDVVANYKALEPGDKTVSVESYKTTKSATVIVEKDMPKQTGFEVPASVLEGAEFEIKAEFDKAKYLDVKDFKLIIPENAGINVVEELSVVENTMVGKFIGTKEFDGVVTCTYLGKVFGEPKRLKVRGLARVKNVELDATEIKLNQVANGTITFNKVMEDDQTPVEVTVNSYLELSTPFTLNENKLGGTFAVKGIKSGNGKVTVSLAGDETVKDIMVEDLPPLLEKVVLAKDTIRKGETTHMSLTFNKPETATRVAIEAPSFVTVDTANPVVSDNVITYNVTGTEVNEVGAMITVTHTAEDMEPATKEAEIKVTADAKVIEFNCNKLTPEVNEEVTISFTADKKAVDGQEAPEFSMPEKVTVVTPFEFDENGVSGTMVVKCTGLEELVVKASYGAAEMSITFNPVVPNVSVTAIEVDYDSMEKGRKATVVATLDKDPFNLDNISVSVNEFLTFNDDMQINGNTVEFTVNGKEIGAGVITFTARANNMTKEITITDIAVLQEATARVDKVIVNGKAVIDCTFDIVPSRDNLTVTPNDTTAVSMGYVEIEGTKATFEVTILKAVPVSLLVEYGSVQKTIEIEGLATGAEIDWVQLSTGYPVLGDTISATVRFKGEGTIAPEYMDTELSDGLEVAEAFVKNEDTLVGKFRTTALGSQCIYLSYLGGELNEIYLDVLEAAIITEATLSKENDVQINEDVTLTITYDKKRPFEQEKPVITLPQNVTFKEEYTENEERTSGQATLVASQAGTYKVQIVLKDITKEVTFVVVAPAPTPVFDSVGVNPNAIEVDGTCELTCTFTGAAPDKTKLVLTPNEFISVGEITIDGLVAKATVTGVAQGAGTVSCVYDGGEAKVANVTVNAKAPAARARKR